MKKLLFSLLLLIASFHSFSQDLNPVKWTFTALKDSTFPFQIVEIKATIDKDWHIFTANPGGDGLLIPTSIVIDSNAAITKLSPAEIEGVVHTQNMEEIGVVNYYEGEMICRVAVQINKEFRLTGHVEFQSCNDKMCLPPQLVNFSIQMKK